MRRALLAALGVVLVPALAAAEVRYDPIGGTLSISSAHADGRIELRVAGQASRRSMPLAVTREAGSLIVTPRFSLRPGTDYTLSVGDADFAVSVPIAETKAPRVAGFTPSQAVIPANTLRLYIRFTEPMARGQLRDHIRLVTRNGRQIASPFLNLETELWDADQRRATLLLDPGRIKQGVGPNTHGGAPLQAGESYRLVVSEHMRSAAGLRLEAPVSLAFRVGPAERRAIAPEEWDVLVPSAASHTPLTLAFDRVIDSNTALRMLTLMGPDGRRVEGVVHSDGGGWSLSPTVPWMTGTYRLIVDPELEDISGNTPAAPFDAHSGTIGTLDAPHVLSLEIAR
ncbi:Ig-like domain-containing protein [Roseobacteraceae bacterium S113]